jgi:hypothetical protein
MQAISSLVIHSWLQVYLFSSSKLWLSYCMCRHLYLLVSLLDNVYWIYDRLFFGVAFIHCSSLVLVLTALVLVSNLLLLLALVIWSLGTFSYY